MSPQDDRTTGAAEVVLLAEQLSVGVDRVAAERVRITKRIVEEVRTVQVPLRREELVISQEPLTGTGSVPGTAAEDLVLVLHEEVPVVSVAVQAYERVVVAVETVRTEQVLRADLRTEHASVTVEEAQDAPPRA